jgi:adenosylcobinamide-GDP ribazoletransferase
VTALARRLDELVLAMTLLTRIPMPPARSGTPADLARAVWAYPLVGALVGGIGALALTLARAAGVTPDIAAWIALAAIVLATGCFHEDGLADYWDGIGGGQTRDRKLEIMRDSRIGSYGAAALLLSFGVRAACIAQLTHRGMGAAALIAAGVIGRSAIAVILMTLQPARTDGMAATAEPPPLASGVTALALSLVTILILPLNAACAGVAAAGAAALASRRLMQSQIGGYTGDALGATEQKAEIAALVAFAALTAV